MSRVIEYCDSRGQQYADLMRVVGLIACDPVPVHAGLRGFLAPEVVPPGLYVVERPQTWSRKRAEQRRLEEQRRAKR